MKVSEIMSTPVSLISPETTLRETAERMRQDDIGALAIVDNTRLVGMVTDRDLVIRGVADGLDAETPISQLMSSNVHYCFDDEDVEHVAQNMGNLQERRLPVVNRDTRLVGMLSLADVINSGVDTHDFVSKVAQPH